VAWHTTGYDTSSKASPRGDSNRGSEESINIGPRGGKKPAKTPKTRGKNRIARAPVKAGKGASQVGVRNKREKKSDASPKNSTEKSHPTIFRGEGIHQTVEGKLFALQGSW